MCRQILRRPVGKGGKVSPRHHEVSLRGFTGITGFLGVEDERCRTHPGRIKNGLV